MPSDEEVGVDTRSRAPDDDDEETEEDASNNSGTSTGNDDPPPIEEDIEDILSEEEMDDILNEEEMDDILNEEEMDATFKQISGYNKTVKDSVADSWIRMTSQKRQLEEQNRNLEMNLDRETKRTAVLEEVNTSLKEQLSTAATQKETWEAEKTTILVELKERIEELEKKCNSEENAYLKGRIEDLKARNEELENRKCWPWGCCWWH